MTPHLRFTSPEGTSILIRHDLILAAFESYEQGSELENARRVTRIACDGFQSVVRESIDEIEQMLAEARL